MKRFLPLFMGMIILAGCSQPNELGPAMDSMKGPFKTLRESDDIETLKVELAYFLEAASVAQSQKVPAHHQEIFDKGMNELMTLATQAQAALNEGNKEAAQELFKKMGGVRKEFHEKLGVK